jgi:hypothetical protein
VLNGIGPFQKRGRKVKPTVEGVGHVKPPSLRFVEVASKQAPKERNVDL